MSLLVTGTGSGLGKHLLRALEGVAWKRGDTLPESADIIVHCAWPPHLADSADYLADTVGLTERLTGVAHRAFIFVSTVDVYPPGGSPKREDCDPAPTGLYGEAKLRAETIVRKRCQRPLILRCAAMLGSDARPNSLIRVLRGEPVTLTADSCFNYVLHTDVAAFLRFALERELTGVYNVASSGTVALSEIGTTQFGSHRYLTANVDNRKIAALFPSFMKTSLQVVNEFRKQG